MAVLRIGCGVGPGACSACGGSDHFTPTGRNPDGDVQPWCYVAETEEGIYWRYCDIPTCHSEWARLDKGGDAGLPGYSSLLAAPDKAGLCCPLSARVSGLLHGFGGTPGSQRPQWDLNEAHGPGVPSLLPHEGLPGTAPSHLWLKTVTPDLG